MVFDQKMGHFLVENSLLFGQKREKPGFRPFSRQTELSAPRVDYSGLSVSENKHCFRCFSVFLSGQKRGVKRVTFREKSGHIED